MIAERWAALPRPIRKFIVDAVEGGVIAAIGLNFALPHTIPEAQAQALIVVTTVVGPIIAAGRRDILPAVLEWWASVRTSADG